MLEPTPKDPGEIGGEGAGKRTEEEIIAEKEAAARKGRLGPRRQISGEAGRVRAAGTPRPASQRAQTGSPPVSP